MERSTSQVVRQDIVLPEVWSQLRERLRLWLRPRLRSAHDIEDIVSECMLRAWQKFRNAVAALDLWRWCLVTARSLLVIHWRLSKREQASVIHLDALAGPACEVSVGWALTSLRHKASRSDWQTLSMMLAGASNAAIAQARRVTSRAVRLSQARLFHLVREVGKECR
jgi:DNA-directed RNA polymerase specialized sigma24 family protein